VSYIAEEQKKHIVEEGRAWDSVGGYYECAVCEAFIAYERYEEAKAEPCPGPKSAKQA
jgi:hypothetical protein